MRAASGSWPTRRDVPRGRSSSSGSTPSRGCATGAPWMRTPRPATAPVSSSRSLAASSRRSSRSRRPSRRVSRCCSCGAEREGDPPGSSSVPARPKGLEVLAWREVPVDAGALGARARVTMPSIVQAVFRRRPGPGAERREHAAFRARRRIEAEARRDQLDLTVVSCSFSTVTYKALVAADQLAPFYRDLRDPRFAAPFIVFHQRYSTNTAPSWERAQPFRVLCHNGEINTLGANVRRMATREGRLGLESSEIEELFRPSVDPEGSDSSMLDEVIELLIREGATREIAHAVAMTVPAAWERRPEMEPHVRGFYRWHASVMEPWDGPAALIFSDGVAVGAAMDRNGLRPLRSAICEDGLVACASEAGAVDVGGHGLVRRGKLGPGDMLVVDPRRGGVELDPVRRIAMSRPYATWAAEHRIVLGMDHPAAQVPADLLRHQTAFGYGREDVTLLLRPMAADGGEPTFSMGDDTPIAPMSVRRGSVFGHLKQRFAQVTNPAIDHIRERFVMSTTTLLGPRDPLIWERPQAAAQLELPTFVVFHVPRGEVLDATWAAGEGPEGIAPGARAARRRGGGRRRGGPRHPRAQRRGAGPGPRADPVPAGRRRGRRRARARGTPHRVLDRGRQRRRDRVARRRVPARVRRRSRPSASRVRDRRGAPPGGRRRRGRGARPVPRRDRAGRPEDPGPPRHRVRRRLPRRCLVRRRRPVARGHRALPPRDVLTARRARVRGDRGRGARPSRRRLRVGARAAREPRSREVPSRGRVPRDQPGGRSRDPSHASTRGSGISARPRSGTTTDARRAPTSRPATPTWWTVAVRASPAICWPSGRRAGACRSRRWRPRRRSCAGSRAPRCRTGRSPARRTRRSPSRWPSSAAGPTREREARTPPGSAPRGTRRSSRSPPPASASPRSTARSRTSSRSRSRRARSRAREGSSPGTR